MDVWYATREAVKAALDSPAISRDNAQIDRALESASRDVEKLCHRPRLGFAPITATRYFDWPDIRGSRSWRLWLDADEVVSITTLTAGSTIIGAADYFLEPANDGPPYDRIEIDLASSSAFSAGATHQRAIAVSGVFGYRADESPAGLLAGAINTSVTAVTVSNSAAVGIGDLVRIDSERMLVTAKSMVSTGQTLQTPVGESTSEQVLVVASGAAYAVGEVLLLDAERVLITDIAGNNLVVQRAWDGTNLDAHTGSTIYAPRTLTVVRAAYGTTAASHLDAAAVTRHDPPGLVRDLTLAEALNQMRQEDSGYGHVIRSGAGAEDQGGAGLEDLRMRCRRAHGRRRQGVI